MRQDCSRTSEVTDSSRGGRYVEVDMMDFGCMWQVKDDTQASGFSHQEKSVQLGKRSRGGKQLSGVCVGG